MSTLAEDLIGVPLAFALAQKPHMLDSGEYIATLAPLVNLHTGELLSADPASFPSSGYVFWWAVPNGSWNPGDIVVGTLEQSRKYQIPEQDWYQFHSSRGHAAQSEVFEAVRVYGKPSDSFRWLVDGSFRFSCSTRPNAVFYVWTDSDLIGPFHAADVTSEGNHFTYFCAPVDVNGGIVKRYPNSVIESEGKKWNLSQTVTVSLNDASPRRSNSVDVDRHYCLIRREDLERWQSEAIPISLLPDELVIARACKRISGRAKQRELRSQLESLLERLKEEDGTDKAIEDGLSEILAKARLSEAMTDQIVDSLIQSGEFGERINLAVSAQIDAAVRQKAGEIEERAEVEASERLEDLNKLGEQIASLKKDREQAESDLRKVEESRIELELQAEQIVSSVSDRLQAGRKELIGDLALFGPIFQGNGHTPAEYNGCARISEAPIGTIGVASQLEGTESVSVAVTSPELSDAEFIRGRLWPYLVNHGCCLSERDAEFFHIAALSSRLLSLPHPGWAAAYVDAMGGTASITTVSVAPSWLDFDSAFRGELANSWRRGIRDPDRLHFIVLEGIDRPPSHAWLRPWLSILAGWTRCLPGDDSLKWPENIRLCVTEEKSAECFTLSNDLCQWILSCSGSATDNMPSPVQDGYFPMEKWTLQTTAHTDEPFDGFIKSLELPQGEPYTRARIELAIRLRAALLRCETVDADRVEAIITRRFFSCWSKESTE